MRTTARIIDANANRCREGLRVLEDVARFTLNDGALAEELKNLRHAVTEGVSGLLPTDLGLAQRDAEGDVGREVSTEGERSRPDLRAVARAAAGRVGEALRVLEECAKVSGGAGAGFEAVRYRAYDAGARVVGSLVPRAPQWALCVLVTESLCRRPWLEVAEGSVAGGADCVQLREKNLPVRALIDRARALVEMVGGRATVVINDRPEVALLSGAGAVHLGQSDLSPAEARAIAGPGLVVGVSCSSAPEAARAVRDGASYLGLGAMFATASKANPSVRGPALIGEVMNDPGVANIPHLAIGGIGPENAGQVVRAGARGLAVSSCVCGAGDPEAVCRELLRVAGGAGSR